MSERKHPVPAVDLIIEIRLPDGRTGIVLIERKNPPHGWALPGGFVDYGETLEQAAIREAREETSLQVELIRQFHTYSDPGRDPRRHTISTVFIARAEGTPEAADDAGKAGVFTREEINFPLAFDHRQILDDYFAWREKHPAEQDRVEPGQITPSSETGPEQEETLVELTRVWSLAEAEVIKSFLGTNGIYCLLKGQIVHSIYPFTMDGLGETIIMVLQKDLEKARHLLEEYAPSRTED
ncbi:MAG: NUDIX domain-containing protein [Candidatus Aminicenantes bacterium]|nr:NUDIX domain-containing protein [Candidatus Aminicenantes bacterium]